MKLQSKMLSVVAFLVLAMPMIGGAAPVGTFSSDLGVFTGQATQTFYGDGAVYGDGFLQPPPVDQNGTKCLQCHQGVPADFDASVIIPDKRLYLRTGHGNMLKKVTAPPQAWKGATGDLYPMDSVGHVIDWAKGTVDLGGFCDVGGFEGQFLKSTCESTTACTLDASNYPAAYTTSDACTKAGGTWKKGKWTAASRPATISYLIGDWMSIDAPDIGIAGGGQSGLAPNIFWMADGRTYGTCGSCHTAGYKANDYTRPQPFADYPNFPKSAKAGVGGSWVLDGIQCERCHDATNHFASPFTVFVPRGTFSTAVCSQCHIRPAAWEGSANPNASTQPTAYPIGASATNFGSHLIGKQLLNSPHGKFTGAYAQIATRTDLYNSRFGIAATGAQGGCDTCHDVHQTTIVEILPEGPGEGDVTPALASARVKPMAVSGTPAPIRRECFDCHSDKVDQNGALTSLRHPRGAGTPQGDGSDVAGACETCHMPRPGGTPIFDTPPFVSGGLRVHVMRINTDPNYSTFPAAGATTPGICSDPYYKTRATCIAAGKSWSLVANSAPDGDFTNAVWVDLNLACGQCHNAGNGAPVLSKQQVAQYAKGIHGTSGNTNLPPIALGLASATVSGFTVTFVDNSYDDSFANPDLVDPKSKLRIAVNWGDGTIDTGLAGSTFVHTYKTAGKKIIRHTAIDTAGLRGFEKVTVTVPQ